MHTVEWSGAHIIQQGPLQGVCCPPGARDPNRQCLPGVELEWETLAGRGGITHFNELFLSKERAVTENSTEYANRESWVLDAATVRCPHARF